MSEQLVTPKFLTPEIAKTVVNEVLNLATGGMSLIAPRLKRHECHIVILVPAMKDDRANDYPDWPNYQLWPHLLYEQSVGREHWAHEYDNIARCKALQLWHDRNDDRTNVIPHLLFPGDTPFWGGVKRYRIVSTCSGFQSHFDKMVSGMVTDGLVAVAYDEFEKWRIYSDKRHESFLS